MREILDSWDNSISGELIGNILERVMQQVTDMTDLEAGPRTDFLVGQFLVEFQPNQLPVTFMEMSADRMLSPALRVRTPLPGLLLAGQDVVSPGINGAFMGGWMAAANIEPALWAKIAR